MDPRYRAVLVVSLLLTVLWGINVGWIMLAGGGIDPHRYVHGIVVVGSSTLAGFLLVWALTRLMALQKTLKTGFEADVKDEFGTGFAMLGSDGKPAPFKLSLSKFLPSTIAPPNWPGLHPLEAEIIGFLHGYRHWPVDISAYRPGEPFTSLYEQALARWQVMRHLPGSGPMHRVAALAKDLSLVHAYREERVTYPLHEFWKRDRVNFHQRCMPHGGMAAFVLSTFPALRAMSRTPEGTTTQRALLTALRYQNQPNQMPLNAGPLARELVDYLWRADAQLQQLDVRELDQMGPNELNTLRNSLSHHWQTMLGNMTPTGTPDAGMQALKLTDGSVWVLQSALLAELGPALPPDLRQTLRLWDVEGGVHHPSWPHISAALQDAGLIASSHDGQAATNGCFTLACGPLMWGPAVKLVSDPAKVGSILKQWNGITGWEETPELVLDVNQLAAHTQAQAGDVDALLARMF